MWIMKNRPNLISGRETDSLSLDLLFVPCSMHSFSSFARSPRKSKNSNEQFTIHAVTWLFINTHSHRWIFLVPRVRWTTKQQQKKHKIVSIKMRLFLLKCAEMRWCRIRFVRMMYIQWAQFELYCECICVVRNRIAIICIAPLSSCYMNVANSHLT